MVPAVTSYWDSWPGKWQQWRVRQARAVHLLIPGEPIQKSDRRAASHAVEIRAQLDHEFRSTGRATLTGPIALSLHFTTDRTQPPDLPKLAKYLLDVLGRQDGTRGPALYRDDRQVKLLHVSWSNAVGKPSSPSTSTRILARPLRDVVDDLRLADDIKLTTGGEDEQRGSPFAVEELPDDDWPSWPRERDVADPRDPTWELLRRQDRRRRQDVLLQRTGAFLRSLLTSLPERIAGARPPRRRPRLEPYLRATWAQLEQTYDQSWALLSTQPFTVPLPRLPMQTGEQAAFQRNLVAQLAQFADRWPTMVPLEAPLNVTLLVLPPQQGKDLDNLALQVLPALLTVLKPAIPSELAVVSYQVIELARRPGDPPEGYLQVVLGTETRCQSDWDRINAYVGEHPDQDLG